MKFMRWGKDGGPESKVWGFYIIEIKKLFSVVLLKFEDGSRESFHDHAFNAMSWLLKGALRELALGDTAVTSYSPSIHPIHTPRTRFHQVRSVGRSWAITFRGPWHKYWHEYVQEEHVTLTDHRKVL